MMYSDINLYLIYIEVLYYSTKAAGRPLFLTSPSYAGMTEMKKLNHLERCVIMFLGAKDCEPVPTPLHLHYELFLLSRVDSSLSRSLKYHRTRRGSYRAAVEKALSTLESAGMIRWEGLAVRGVATQVPASRHG